MTDQSSDHAADALRPYERPELLKATGGPLRPGGLELTRQGLDRLELSPGAWVLDLGCGAGPTLGLLVGLGYQAIGLDVSATLLKLASGHGPTVRGEASALPFRDACFDAVTCECVLSLMADPLAVLAEIDRTLKPDGRLLVSDLHVDDDSGRHPNAPRLACLDGAHTLPGWSALFEAAGFASGPCADHTRELTRMVGQLIFAGARLKDIFGPGLTSCCGQRVKAGYFQTVLTRI